MLRLANCRRSPHATPGATLSLIVTLPNEQRIEVQEANGVCGEVVFTVLKNAVLEWVLGKDQEQPEARDFSWGPSEGNKL